MYFIFFLSIYISNSVFYSTILSTYLNRNRVSNGAFQAKSNPWITTRELVPDWWLNWDWTVPVKAFDVTHINTTMVIQLKQTLCVTAYPVCTLCVPCVYPVCTLCVPWLWAQVRSSARECLASEPQEVCRRDLWLAWNAPKSWVMTLSRNLRVEKCLNTNTNNKYTKYL